MRGISFRKHPMIVMDIRSVFFTKLLAEDLTYNNRGGVNGLNTKRGLYFESEAPAASRGAGPRPVSTKNDPSEKIG